MPSLTVINTSPLIFLSKGGYLEFLQVLSAEIVVPMAVRDEIYAYGEDGIAGYAKLGASLAPLHAPTIYARKPNPFN
ncbi:MAG: hypothetical protein RIE73_35435 [Coleofasciculus sp. C1-SOL-03]|uniref:hypothetical protein n=1 Tax=Coleofasciculus sp. C1-SOL-03 TaxID=3069522 RepID=UPI0032F9694F